MKILILIGASTSSGLLGFAFSYALLEDARVACFSYCVAHISSLVVSTWSMAKDPKGWE